MKNNNHPAAMYKTMILAGMLLFISYDGFGQQAVEISFEAADQYEIVIVSMPSLSDKLFGKDFVYEPEKDMGFETWMINESSWFSDKNIAIMDFEFVHAEKELALEAWMTQTFKLEDRAVEEDLTVEEWMLADTEWFELN